MNIRTVKRVIVKGYTNDLGFSIGNRYICLVEAQSYSLKAIQMRMLFYLSETYQNYLDDMDATLYDIADANIPRWEAYVVSTGGPNEGVYRLGTIGEDLTDKTLMKPVTTKNVKILTEYIRTCEVIDNMISAEGDASHRRIALNALEACRDRCRSIGDYVWSKRSEIMGVYQQLFDDEENREMLEKAYAKIGMEEGRQQGLEEGRREGLEEGRREGLEQGMEQGRTLERETIIKGMLSKNLSPEDISEMTDLPLDYIAGIASESEKNPSKQI